MNIYDLPIANFGELNEEAALKLILEVRKRRRLVHVPQRETKIKPVKPKAKKEAVFNTPMGKLTKEQMLELLSKLRKE